MSHDKTIKTNFRIEKTDETNSVFLTVYNKHPDNDDMLGLIQSRLSYQAIENLILYFQERLEKIKSEDDQWTKK